MGEEHKFSPEQYGKMYNTIWWELNYTYADLSMLNAYESILEDLKINNDDNRNPKYVIIDARKPATARIVLGFFSDAILNLCRITDGGTCETKELDSCYIRANGSCNVARKSLCKKEVTSYKPGADRYKYKKGDEIKPQDSATIWTLAYKLNRYCQKDCSIDLLGCTDILNTIRTIRNKSLAHTDNDLDQARGIVKAHAKDVERLTDCLREVLNTLCFTDINPDVTQFTEIEKVRSMDDYYRSLAAIYYSSDAGEHH